MSHPVGSVRARLRHNSISTRASTAFFFGLLLATLSLIHPTLGDEKELELGSSSIRMLDMSGQLHLLGEKDGTRATVVVFLSTECPVARQLIPELGRIHERFRTEHVEFYGVFSDPSVTWKQADLFVKEFGIKFPVLFDGSGELAHTLKPSHVPEAFLINAHRAVVYRGRINDMYRQVGKRQLEATENDLINAIAATIEGRLPDVRFSQPVGCPIENLSSDTAKRKVTYNRDIAPLVFANCTECHRSGEVAPFALESFNDCVKRGDWLVKVTEKKLMPPWMAEAGHGDFLGERSLSARQRELLKEWVASGMPEGNPDDLPVPPDFIEGWRLGEPSLVLDMPYETIVPADGPDIFQHYVVRVPIPEDKTLVGFEFRPGNPAVVHHAVVFYDMMGAARIKDAKTPEPGYHTFGSPGVPVTGVVGVWVPGMTPRFLPKGIGMHIPKGADLLVQFHIHPSGKKEVDRSKIALYFADEGAGSMHKMSRVPLVLGTLMIDVPAGESNHKLISTMTIPAPITLMSVVPHMHLIGKEMKITATFPSGESKSLVWIKDWNFYWQDNYVYREPIELPAGTQITIEGRFDNSEANPLNPSHPPKRVFFGNDSDEEMFFAVFQTVGKTREAEQAIEHAVLTGFQEDWKNPSVRPDARPRIFAEALEFLGGGDILLKLLINGDKAPLLQSRDGG